MSVAGESGDLTEGEGNGVACIDDAEERSPETAALKPAETGEDCSPRGVFDGPVTGSGLESCSDSDHGSSVEVAYSNLSWKRRLFFHLKLKRSVWSLPIISLLRGKNSSLCTAEFTKNTETPAGSVDFTAAKPSWRNFTFQELSQATDNFSPHNLIGRGGHAQVFGGCLPDGHLVAVKKITKEKKKDEEALLEDFLSELGIVAHVDHPNAAKLIGFSSDSGLYLVLQLSPHGSLANVLHGSEEALKWSVRYKVAVGIAEGLQYLHNGCQKRIIHRDITASNILLSKDYQPEISDFGLAKWLPDKWPHLVVAPIEGTFGYMAPEYFMHGIVNEKTDVFAFGVLLLELITGRRAVDSTRQSLVMWAKPLLERRNVAEIADPRLGEAGDRCEIRRAIFTASVCIHNLPNKRPSMKRVVQLLKGEKQDTETKQSSSTARSVPFACELEDYTCTTYLRDLNRHMKLVMDE